MMKMFFDFIRRLILKLFPLSAHRAVYGRVEDWLAYYQKQTRGQIAVTGKKEGGEFPRVSILILTYNNLLINKLCLESVFVNTNYPDFEVIVVDNASSDGTPEWLKQYSQSHPNLHIILNTENCGFAGGNNQAARLATGEYLVFLNNDTVVTRNWIQGLLKYFQRDPRVGLVGPVTNSTGNEARVYTSYRSPSSMEKFAEDRSRKMMGQSFDIRMLAFYCVMAKKDQYEAMGGLDEQFGVGMFEDDDLAVRYYQMGYRVVCAEDVFIHHFQGASFGRLEKAHYMAVFDENRRKYEKKWGREWEPYRSRIGDDMVSGVIDAEQDSNFNYERLYGKWVLPFLFLLLVVVLLYKHLFLIAATGPIIMYDELLYKNNALRLFSFQLFAPGEIYPPLYSLILSPAFLFDNWYDSMIVINGLLSSFFLIPVWFLARKFVSPPMAMFLVLLTALLPFQVVYPRFIMSENLAMLLFMSVMVLAVDGTKGSKWRAIVLGLVLGLSFLTKYLFLPAIFIIILYWFLVDGFGGGSVLLLGRDNVIKAAFLLIGLALAIIPWVVFAIYSNLPLYKAFGGGISGIRSTDISVFSFVQFALAYFSYLVLSNAPMLVPLLLFGAPIIRRDIRRRLITKDVKFLLLVFMLAGLYWLVGTQHSFGAVYNYPIPQNIQGRYLMYLTPLLMIAGGMVVERFCNTNLTWSPRNTFFVTGLTVLLFYFLHWYLYRDNIFGLPDWFASSVFLLPDTFFYGDKRFLYFGLSVISGFGMFLWFLGKRRWHPVKIILWSVLLISLTWQGLIFKFSAEHVQHAQEWNRGWHMRSVAQILRSKSNEVLSPGLLVFDLPGLNEPQVVGGLEFWGIEIESEKVLIPSAIEYPLIPGVEDEVNIVVSSIKTDWPILGTYDFYGANYYIYHVDSHDPQWVGLEIVDYSDINVVLADQASNVQQNVWLTFALIIKNATPTTVLIFNDKELETTVSSSDALTVFLDHQDFLQEEMVEMYLLDKLTGEKSEPVIIEIHKP